MRRCACPIERMQKGAEISIKAAVSELAEPGDAIMLRFALTEERIRYQGGNGLRYSHNVVRAMPGGPKGVSPHQKGIRTYRIRRSRKAPGRDHQIPQRHCQKTTNFQTRTVLWP